MMSLGRSMHIALCIVIGLGCGPPSSTNSMDQSKLRNEAVRERAMLSTMYADEYFPDHVVNACKSVLVDMCHQIESERPQNVGALYVITHRATERLNDLQEVFDENGSELETAARESLGMEFDFIAKAYGFEADVEALMAPREW